MSTTDTDMGAAMKRAGFNSGVRLHAVASHCLAESGGDMARFGKALWRELVADEELRMSAMMAFHDAVEADMQGMSGKGQWKSADSGQFDDAQPRQQNGGGAGRGGFADNGQLEHARPSPTSKGPSKAAIKAAGYVAKKASQNVLDSFRITMRQGSMEAIGDIRISRYPALLRSLGKRTWVSSREFHLIYLLNMAASKYPQLPAEHTTRDVFTAAEVAEMVKAAADLAAPVAGREKADV